MMPDSDSSLSTDATGDGELIEVRVARFIEKWKGIQGERQWSRPFLNSLCELLEVPRPGDEGTSNAYMFERDVRITTTSGAYKLGLVDLYRKDCFVLESKSVKGAKGGQAWMQKMEQARGQAERYAKALAREDGWPPFLLVVDIGFTIDIYADFSKAGHGYTMFPDPGSYRIKLEDLKNAAVRKRLRAIWLDPWSLDPSATARQVTRDAARHLAGLARVLEEDGYDPETVASFLQRCIFTMFAEDAGLLPKNYFLNHLSAAVGKPDSFKGTLQKLWTKMDQGADDELVDGTLHRIVRFNGSFFKDQTVLPLKTEHISQLIGAAKLDWRDVEPAIFGTLLERALNPLERRNLGAHYTPRAHVERLVVRTVIEPLRDEWAATKAAAAKSPKDAVALVRAFLTKLCSTRVLDPACGTGNFLYVTMELMIGLEMEVREALHQLDGGDQRALDVGGATVSPKLFFGMDVNTRAVSIANLVMWIGYIRWRLRSYGGDVEKLPEPIIEDYENIVPKDALMTCKDKRPLQEHGQVVERWDGISFKRHPLTGELVPDESKTVPEYEYVDGVMTAWPEAEYIVGNPPFIGNWRMRSALGSGYTEALRALYKDVPDSCDYVMYWWERAAELLRIKDAKLKRFGFITTNSITQTFSRRIIQRHMAAKKNPLSLLFAIPDHPWVDGADGADVRIAMTVAGVGEDAVGEVWTVTREEPEGDGWLLEFDKEQGPINPDLTIGVDVTSAQALKANNGLCCPGVKLHGNGFKVTALQANSLGYGTAPGLERHIRSYLGGRDVTGRSRELMVIDLFGLTSTEVLERYPRVYQWLVERVKPERDQNRRKTYRENWWIFGEPRANFRPALEGLDRYIATVETAKHRVFVFLDADVLPDNMLVNIASDDPYVLGVLSSHIHVTWSLSAGGRLGVGNDPRYTKTRCFDPFPFPNADTVARQAIREVAASLHMHRSRCLRENLKYTLTDVYNAMERLRAEEDPTPDDRRLNENGGISTLLHLHRTLDAAVAAAYGWPVNISDTEILRRLVELNAARAAEENAGLARWLRPEFQAPEEATQLDAVELAGAVTAEGAMPVPVRPWPGQKEGGLAAQMLALRRFLVEAGQPVTVEQIANGFKGAGVKTIDPLVDALVTLGQAHRVGKDKTRMVA